MEVKKSGDIAATEEQVQSDDDGSHFIIQQKKKPRHDYLKSTRILFQLLSEKVEVLENN